MMMETAQAQLHSQVASLASSAGLAIIDSAPATSFSGAPTTRFQLALTGFPARQTQLELSDAFAADKAEFAQQLRIFLSETAQRLRNPVPNALLTLGGIPLTATKFEWPFHESTAGADTSLVHGEVHLADGSGTPLFAKIAASMTVTFREIVQAPEQPFAESFILNAVRKTFDQGQLELVKSGNRQPVPVTTRFYSPRTQKFVFNDTTEQQRKDFLAAKVFWLSGALGGGEPVWLLDPRDAQYLNATIAELKVSLDALARDGVIKLANDPAYAAPSAALLARRPQYEAHLAEALAAIKPSFNEEMRGGHTNM